MQGMKMETGNDFKEPTNESKIEKILDLYKVKTEKLNGDYLTIFPQLDFEFNLRTIKKMK